MNERERFFEVALFGNPDKIPLAIGDARPATKNRWVREGLPENANVIEYLGLKDCILKSVEICSFPSEGFKWEPNPSKVNIGPIPPFRFRKVKEDERYRFWVDSLGITQMGLKEDWEDGWSGFATRVFIDFPVKNRLDLEKIKKRYYPRDPRRYPKDWDEFVRKHKKRNYLLSATIRGPFWWTRDLIGLTGIAVGIYREPEFIKEIMDMCAEFHIETLRKAFEDLEIDYVMMNEDIAYKKGPMISPDAARKYMGPAYRELTKFFRDHGTKIIGVDSDGNIDSLIPVWLDFGISWVKPCEAASGINVVELGKKYPSLVMSGGIDKRKLSQTKDALEEEVLSKVPILVKRKGYFPGVDHAVPPDVPFENFVYLVSLLKEICGWTTR
ncbi:MAG: uroporphyrinogen decarboxylase family protein [Nitrososphaerota archaeon]|nr:hypothetical protein [Candidatus Bathyarchaeota archaeon]MDW8048696.1 uroporphyrinogen decarboxylase family protein [Nitrososphaerota archaeon]